QPGRRAGAGLHPRFGRPTSRGRHARLEGHLMNALIEGLRHRLVVSCQAYPGEPMRTPDTMRRVALAAAQGGAAGIRAQGLADIAAIREAVDLPLIGLWKDGNDDVFITPTLEHALSVARAGAHVVALDATARPRP